MLALLAEERSLATELDDPNNPFPFTGSCRKLLLAESPSELEDPDNSPFPFTGGCRRFPPATGSGREGGSTSFKSFYMNQALFAIFKLL